MQIKTQLTWTHNRNRLEIHMQRHTNTTSKKRMDVQCHHPSTDRMGNINARLLLARDTHAEYELARISKQMQKRHVQHRLHDANASMQIHQNHAHAWATNTKNDRDALQIQHRHAHSNAECKYLLLCTKHRTHNHKHTTVQYKYIQRAHGAQIHSHKRNNATNTCTNNNDNNNNMRSQHASNSTCESRSEHVTRLIMQNTACKCNMDNDTSTNAQFACTPACKNTNAATITTTKCHTNTSDETCASYK